MPKTKKVAAKELQELYKTDRILKKLLEEKWFKQNITNIKKRKENIEELKEAISELEDAKKHDKRFLKLANILEKKYKEWPNRDHEHKVKEAINFCEHFVYHIKKTKHFVIKAKNVVVKAKNKAALKEASGHVFSAISILSFIIYRVKKVFHMILDIRKYIFYGGGYPTRSYRSFLNTFLGR